MYNILIFMLSVFHYASLYVFHHVSPQFMSMVYPLMIMASSVVSPDSSGLPPQPTLPSHCSISQRAQPFSTASNTEPPDCRVLHAIVQSTTQSNIQYTFHFRIYMCSIRSKHPPTANLYYSFIHLVLVQDTSDTHNQADKESLCTPLRKLGRDDLTFAILTQHQFSSPCKVPQVCISLGLNKVILCRSINAELM